MSDATPETTADSTPDSTPTSSIYKTLTWILVAALIGLYALYNWYDGRLKGSLAGKDAEMAGMVQRLTSAESSLRSASDTEAGLRSEIARMQTEAQAAAAAAAGALEAARQELGELQMQQEASAQELASRQSEIDRLTQELGQAETREQQLKTEMESLGETHAAKLQGLQAELNAALQAAADQKADLQAAAERAAGLDEDIAGLKQALADADARAAAEAESLRSELQGRIDFFRTALEGSEPDRAAQIAKLEETSKSEYAALEQTLKDRETELNARLEEAIREAESQSQALQSAQQVHTEEIREARGNLFAQEQELKRVQGELADLQTKLDQTVADLETKLEQGEQALGAAKAELEAAAAAAAEERQRLETQIREAEARAAALEETLTTERAQAQQALAEERRQAEAKLRVVEESDAQILAETRGLYSRFAELAARQTDRGMLLKLAEEDLRFPSGLAVLPRGELPSLDRIADLLKEHPRLSALIEGHTDSAGPDDINLEMSKARAEAVKQALIARGVPEDRLTAEGAGEARPIADNATAAGRGQNRRVEVYVLGASD